MALKVHGDICQAHQDAFHSIVQLETFLCSIFHILETISLTSLYFAKGASSLASPCVTLATLSESPTKGDPGV